MQVITVLNKYHHYNITLSGTQQNTVSGVTAYTQKTKTSSRFKPTLK